MSKDKGGRIKITGGNYSGRAIKTPGLDTHPMGERERLALFNMLFDYIPDSVILDAFSGSGALGIEALSRGASSVVFVEKNPKACQVIRENLKKLGLSAEVIKNDVVNFTTDTPFDVILADPPYDRFEISEVKHLLQFIKSGGLLVLSHPGEVPELPDMEFLKTRKYAGANISIFCKR